MKYLIIFLFLFACESKEIQDMKDNAKKIYDEASSKAKEGIDYVQKEKEAATKKIEDMKKDAEQAKKLIDKNFGKDIEQAKTVFNK